MNKSEFEFFYDSYSGAVYRTAFMMLKNRSDAEDITQESFIALYKRDGTFNDNEHIKAWLLRVCSNKSKNLLKRRSIERKYLTVPEQIKTDSEILSEVLLLEPNQRTAIYLFYYEGYSTDEIAKITGKSGGAIRVLLTRARTALKQTIELD